MYTGNIIDTHMHLWHLKNNYPWLATDVPTLIHLGGNYDSLKQNFLAEDYIALVKDHKVTQCVHVEAFGFEGDPIAETKWLQDQADQFGFPQGIVAHADLHDPHVEDVIKQHCQYPNVRGIRMALNYSDNPPLQMAERGDYLSDKQWRKGFGLLAKYNLLFDLQIFDNQIEDAISLAREFPDINIVVEHFAWPLDASEQHLPIWRQKMVAIAECPNVFIKLSAIGWVFKKANFETLNRYVLEVIKIFGTHRCMFGSNFPPDRLFYSFNDLILTFKKMFSIYSESQQHQLFYENAKNIYLL